jgi:hypothetical protein
LPASFCIRDDRETTTVFYHYGLPLCPTIDADEESFALHWPTFHVSSHLAVCHAPPDYRIGGFVKLLPAVRPYVRTLDLQE